MNPLNSVLVEGNLVRDPQLTKVSTGISVCSFSIAVNRSYKQNDELKESVSYFDVEVWAKLAENCAQYLSKGRGVRVSGHLQQDRWGNAEGEPRYRVKVVGEHVEFLSSRRNKQNKGTKESKETDSSDKLSEVSEEAVASIL